MIGKKITDLPANPNIKETDQFVLVRGGATRRVPGSVFLVGLEQVERYIIDFDNLLLDTIRVKDSPTINLFYDSSTRTLSGEFAGSSLLSPQKPLLYTHSITAVDAFHNRTVSLSSYDDLTICLPVGIAPGVTTNFLRAGEGEVTFVIGEDAIIKTSPDPTYVNIKDQYSFVTAYCMDGQQWFLTGETGSHTSGFLKIEGDVGPIPTPTPSITPTITPTPSLPPIADFYNITTDGDIFNIPVDKNAYVLIDPAVVTFTLTFDGVDGITFANEYNPTNVDYSYLGITTNTVDVSANKTKVCVTHNVSINTINGELYTFYYFNANPLIVGIVRGPSLMPPYNIPLIQDTLDLSLLNAEEIIVSMQIEEILIGLDNNYIIPIQ
jgi:hypothetical protein